MEEPTEYHVKTITIPPVQLNWKQWLWLLVNANDIYFHVTADQLTLQASVWDEIKELI